jgi:predicted Zn-dependent peptidase
MMKPLRSPAFFLLVLLSIFVSFPLHGEGEESDATSKYLELDNGLKVVLLRRDQLPMVNMVLAADVGSKNETPATSGLVHLLEHLILLGETEFHTGDEANLEMRRRGAYFNAHTNHDFMTFEISLPSRYGDFGLKMLKEKVFHLKLTPERLEKEKGIIFEEMAQHHDNPFNRGILLALQNLFKGHPYQQPISGDPEAVKNATVEVLGGFYKQYFIPSNCALAIVGDIDVKSAEEKVRRLFGSLKKPADAPGAGDFPKAVPLEKKIKVKEEMDINQARLIIGFQAPHSDHRGQLAVEVFNQVVGKGINPLLGQMMVRRGRRLTYSISTRYIPLRYGGAFLVILAVEPRHLKAVETNVLRFFNKVAWNFKYSEQDYPSAQQFRVTDYLVTAKNVIKYNYQRFQELGLNSAVAYATYILYHGESKQERKLPYMERLEKVTSSDLRDAASDFFSGKKYVVITLMPGKKKK